jgi:hypothetical protein
MRFLGAALFLLMAGFCIVSAKTHRSMDQRNIDLVSPGYKLEPDLKGVIEQFSSHRMQRSDTDVTKYKTVRQQQCFLVSR